MTEHRDTWAKNDNRTWASERALHWLTFPKHGAYLLSGTHKPGASVLRVCPTWYSGAPGGRSSISQPHHITRGSKALAAKLKLRAKGFFCLDFKMKSTSITAYSKRFILLINLVQPPQAAGIYRSYHTIWAKCSRAGRGREGPQRNHCLGSEASFFLS